MDAPTQSRSYATPSATSKKRIPAAFENRTTKTLNAKKRKTNSSAAVSVSEDPEPSSASASASTSTLDVPVESLEDAIAAKRRQNTLAARKSRIRKANHLQGLESLVEIVSSERNLLLAFAREAMERCPDLAESWGRKLEEGVGGWGEEEGGRQGEKEARRLIDGDGEEE